MATDRQAAQAQKQDTGSTNPGKDLKLESITASGIQSPEYTGQIESYKKASYYIAVAYLAAECSLFLCIALNLVSGCFPSTVLWSEVFACIATIWLFTASIVSVVKFGQLRDTFSSNLGSTGLQVTLGLRVYILSFIGFAESLLAAIALAVQSARSKSRKPQRILGRGSNLQDPSRGADAAKGPHETAFVKPGFMRRVTTWNRHEYTQFGEQAVIIHRRTVGPDEDHQGLVAAVEGDDFSHEYPDDIAMGDMPPARNSSRDRDRKNYSTVYDPYTAP
ncbi:integral membrane protein [Seiridium cupressi]